MKNKIILCISILSIIVLILSGCHVLTTPNIPDQVGGINHNPIISELSVSPRTAFTNQNITITCTASDQDDDTLTYSWSSKPGGTITGSGLTITWTTPATEGTYTITCMVSDGKEGKDNKLVDIIVAVNGVRYQIPWSETESNGWANPLAPPGKKKELFTNTAYDYDSGIYLHNWGKKHMGIDIDSEEGDDVYPIAGGTVAAIIKDESNPMRTVVIIKHTNSDKEDFFAIYGHVLAGDGFEDSLEEDGKVKVGEKIGKIITAGSGPHLHFGINTSSKFIDDFRAGKCGFGLIPESDNPSKYGWVDPIEYLNTHLPSISTTPSFISWTTESPMLTPRSWAPAVQYGGKIYVVGGCSSSTPAQFYNAVATLEVYDPATDTWEKLAPMSMPRVGPAAASLNGKIYVFGGFNRDTWSANDSMEIYDIATNTWTTGASMPTPRSWMKAVVLDNKIYVIGGVGYGYRMDTEAYDPAIDTWEVKSPILPGERYLHAVVAYNGKIYVIGGDSYEYGYNEVWNDIQEYDPIIDCWTKKSPMPDSATGLDAVAINGKIYVFGGNGLARQYDIATDAWQELTSDQDSIDSFSVCLYNNEVYRFGGGGWGPTSNIVESADLR